MVKKLGQRRFLLKSGYTEEELDKMSPSIAHSLIRDMEEANRKRREKEACISQLKDSNEIIEETAKDFADFLKSQMNEREYMGVKYKQGIFCDRELDELVQEFLAKKYGVEE